MDYITLIIRDLCGIPDDVIQADAVIPETITVTPDQLREAIERRVNARINNLKAQTVTRTARDMIRQRREELSRMIDTTEDQIERFTERGQMERVRDCQQRLTMYLRELEALS